MYYACSPCKQYTGRSYQIRLTTYENIDVNTGFYYFAIHVHARDGLKKIQKALTICSARQLQLYIEDHGPNILIVFYGSQPEPRTIKGIEDYFSKGRKIKLHPELYDHLLSKHQATRSVLQYKKVSQPTDYAGVV